VERGYRREILGKRKRKRARWSLDTEEKYWEKEKEKELGGAWIQKRNNIWKKKKKKS